MKTLRKWMTVIVIVCFAFMVQEAVVPIEDNAPAATEKAGDSPQVKAKSLLLPIVLAVVGVAVVATVVLLLVAKTTYDIRGTWEVSAAWDTGGSFLSILTFTGELESGTGTEINGPNLVYTVDDKNVHWETISFYPSVFTGTFDGKNKMSGTFNYLFDPGQTGTWSARRIDL